MGHLTINLGRRSYPIIFGEDGPGALRDLLQTRLQAGGRVAILTDSTVWEALKLHRDAVFPDGSVLMILPPGETTKSWVHLSQIFDFLAESGVDRGGLVVALGGGVIGDLAGYAAAAFMRGIDYVQVPTTLLAMVDSSVGGKTGINIKAGKNLVGAFHQPVGVFADPGWLRTLPRRQFAAGMAEVLKYGLICDADLFDDLGEKPMHGPEDRRLESLILRCCRIKASIVEADERETAASGGRMLLNLGHTFGHAIEAVAGYGALLHGEAVGIGLVLAARLSREMGRIGNELVERIESVVRAHDLPTVIPSKYTVEELLAAMMRDKKWKGFTSRFVVLDGIGGAVISDDVGLDIVTRVLREGGAPSVGVVV